MLTPRELGWDEGILGDDSKQGMSLGEKATLTMTRYVQLTARPMVLYTLLHRFDDSQLTLELVIMDMVSGKSIPTHRFGTHRRASFGLCSHLRAIARRLIPTEPQGAKSEDEKQHDADVLHEQWIQRSHPTKSRSCLVGFPFLYVSSTTRRSD